MSLPIHHHAPRHIPAQQPLAGDLTLQRGRVHELCGPSRLILAARIMARCHGPVVQPLADPSRLILVQAPHDESLLWAAEEALRSGAAPTVIAELLAPPALTPTRRLHLAAETGAEVARRDRATAPLGLILLSGPGGAQGVESRWHLAPAPSRSLLWSEEESFTLTRLRARLLPPARWALHTRRMDETLEPLSSGES